jgi:hypothetical protein
VKPERGHENIVVEFSRVAHVKDEIWGKEQVGFAVTDDKGYVYICYVPVNEHGKIATRNRRGSVTRLPLEAQRSYYHSLNKVTMPSGAVLYGEIRCDSTSHRTIVVNEKQMKPREFHEYLADMYGEAYEASDIFV